MAVLFGDLYNTKSRNLKKQGEYGVTCGSYTKCKLYKSLGNALRERVYELQKRKIFSRSGPKNHSAVVVVI